MKRIIVILLVLVIGFVILSVVRHKISSSREKNLLIPLGELVEVNGHNMSIYTEGEGDKTLVFLSGSGTCSPILDFRSLYSLMSNEYKIVVVEKFGYGYSDDIDETRDIDTILGETRMALNKAGIRGPYVLCPHSMSGLEALYWTQRYPEEVEAIIGLDMAVPEYYDEMQIHIPVLKLGQYSAALGITRCIPNLAESDAIRFGTLSEKEKEIYRALFYQKTATVTMIDEAKAENDLLCSPLLYYHVRENSTNSGVSGLPIKGSFLSKEVSTAISSSVSVKSNNAKFSRICSGFALLGMIVIFFWVRNRSRICAGVLLYFSARARTAGS